MNLSELNREQQQAVTAEAGPLLILAGAGSGKTKALTWRIAHLLERGIHPSRILALTFTNKAAEEMRERIEELVGVQSAGLWMGTFHAMALRILRSHSELIQFNRDFLIYDSSDQRTLIRQCMQELGMNLERITPQSMRSIISQAKSQMTHPGDYHQYLDEEFHDLYRLYESRLRSAQAMDFDNILLFLVQLLEEHEDVRSYYEDRFLEVLVDEYQDTNRVQYQLVHLLCKNRGNLVVVGDVDQSIYGWRGADIRNILEFQKDFQDARIIKLEQNYRSSANILKAANAVIENNLQRPKKNLWTEAGEGDKILLYQAATDQEEAQFIVDDIESLHREGKAFQDMAILYRTHAQSRLFEEKLGKRGIGYQLIGSQQFYERREVKDLLAYLRILVNDRDDLSFERILGIPKKGLGNKFIEKLHEIRRVQGLSLSESALFGIEEALFGGKQLNTIRSFMQMLEEIREKLDSETPFDIARLVYEASGYEKMLKDSPLVEDQSRLENLDELFNSLQIFTQEEGGTLDEYLQGISLQSETDQLENIDVVTLMTLHSSKGLEYDHIYLCGMDDDLFPSFMSKESESGIEEERRLCYVGITRARKRLVLTRADRRFRFGKMQFMRPSPFLQEIPAQILEESLLKRVEAPFLQQMPKKKSDGFTPGQRVRHNKFGEGVILSFDAEERLIQIVFEHHGVKKLHVDYAPLRPC